MLAPTRPNFFSLQPLQTQWPTTPDLSPDYSPLSSPLTPTEKRLFPRPLKIFKRPSRKPSTTIPPHRSSLADSVSHASLKNADTPLVSRPLSVASTPNLSPPQSQFTSSSTTTNATPRQTSLVLGSISNCSVCENHLSTLQTYSFPKTAPAISRRIRELFPGIGDSPSFCARCFEAIRAIHICWGCGEEVHRREERVGCGWAWWHWGCMRCLLCRVSPITAYKLECHPLKADAFQSPLPPTPLDLAPNNPLRPSLL